MKFHVLTLFPQMIEEGCNNSITGRAIQNGLLSIHAVDIRDYTLDKHKKVDDYPYGGGAGMLMQAQPVFDAYRSIADECKKKPRVLFMTPQGKTFQQSMARELAKEEEIIFLCGHYEGIDERVLEEIVTDEVSLGDFVLTGGELAAMVMIDAISRMIPGVLHNEDSAQDESFAGNLLEYPQYSRPEEWRGKKVPSVLLSGNHENIAKWRLAQSVERTGRKRPDLYEKYLLQTNMQQSVVPGKKVSNPILKATNVCKTFFRDVKKERSGIFRHSRSVKEEFYAVNSLSLHIKKGEIVGILGPNGAGKTTLLRMLGTLMTPTSGNIQMFDDNNESITDTVKMKERIGYLSGNTKLYQRLSIREMLYVLGEIYHMDKEECRQKIDEIFAALDMHSFGDNRIERLSTGQTQRANIARCLIHSPQLYIFDEPTLGLDIISSDAIIRFMKEEQKRGKTVLYSTHYMEEAQYLCDRIIMIDQGAIIAQGTPAQLMEMTNTQNLREAFHAFMEVKASE